jgi:hypothetical protein
MFTVVVVISITLLLLINDSPAHAFSVDETIAAGNSVYWDYSYYSCITGSFSLNADTNQLSVYCLDSKNFLLFQQKKNFEYYADCTDKLTAMPEKSFSNMKTGLYFVIKNNNAVFSARVNGHLTIYRCPTTAAPTFKPTTSTDSSPSVFLWLLVIPAIGVVMVIVGAVVCIKRRRNPPTTSSGFGAGTNYVVLQQQPQPMFTTNTTTVVEL